MSLFRPIIANDSLGVERSMRQMQSAMNSMFGDLFVGGPLGLDVYSSSPNSRHNLLTAGFSPQVDIMETDMEFSVKADLPGIPKNSVKLEVRDNCLCLSGETSKDTERNEGKHHIRERYCGSFKRSIPLPETANSESIHAKFEDGVLNIAIQKKSPEEAGTRLIDIQSA